MKRFFKEVPIVLPEDRQAVITKLVKQTYNLTGYMAEVGVYNGGSSALIAYNNPNKTLYSFDTFNGMPESDEIDYHKKGDFLTQYDIVKDRLSSFKNIRLVKGVFPSTADIVKYKVFCLVHLDVDIYRSHLDGLNFFYPRLVTGGALVIDDYKWDRCKGVTKATDEFFSKKPENIIMDAKYQAYIIKK